MSADPTFTVVMPAYNVAATVEAAIRSVLAQTRDDFELVVVDDGSTDATAELVAPFADGDRIRLVRQKNRGLAGARNTALELARGTYVSLLDSDDLWLPTYLERVGPALRDAAPEVALVYPDAWILDDATGRIRKKTYWMGDPPQPDPEPQTADEFLRALLWGNFVFVSATVRLAVLREVGPFDTSLRASEDYELWLRLAAHGYRPLRIPERLAVYRLRAGSLTQNQPLMLASLREAYRRVAEEHPVEDAVRARARARVARVDAEIRLVEGKRPVAGVVRGLRSTLAAFKRRLLDRRLWYETPPAAVASAFPELDPRAKRVQSGGFRGKRSVEDRE